MTSTSRAFNHVIYSVQKLALQSQPASSSSGRPSSLTSAVVDTLKAYPVDVCTLKGMAPLLVDVLQLYSLTNSPAPSHSVKTSWRNKAAMSSTSQKHRDFVSEPMGDKPVTDLAGIGPVLGKRLADKGYARVHETRAHNRLINRFSLIRDGRSLHSFASYPNVSILVESLGMYI